MAVNDALPSWYTNPSVKTSIAPSSPTVVSKPPPSSLPTWYNEDEDDASESDVDIPVFEGANFDPRTDMSEGIASQKFKLTPEQEAEQRKAVGFSAGFSGGLPIIPTDSISKIFPKAITEIATAIPQFAQFIGEIVAPDTTGKVVDIASNIDKALADDETYRFLRDTFQGKGLGDIEKELAKLPAYLSLGKLGKDGLKQIVKKVATKKGKDLKKAKKFAAILGGGTGFVVADAVTREGDEIYTPDILTLINDFTVESDTLKEVIDITKNLEINPNDTTQTKRLKQLADIFSGTAIGTLLVKTPSAIYGTLKLVLKGLDNPVTRKATKAVTETIARVDSKTGNLIAKANTKLGRAFNSNAALPPDIAKLAINRPQDKDFILGIKANMEELSNIQKAEGIGDDVVAAYLNEGKDLGITTALKSKLDGFKATIVNNESRINDLLGLSGKDRIGLGFNNGTVYLTRTFEANNNPGYLRNVLKYTKGKTNKKVTEKFEERVEGAREHFKKKFPKASEDELDGIIVHLVQRLSSADAPIIRNIWEGFGGAGTGIGSQVTKVLAKRDVIDEPILKLLGEETGPIAKLASTLSNQNKVIGELEYFSGVEAVFRNAIKNKGGEIELGGLIPGLPTQKISVKSYADPDMAASKTKGKLADLTEAAIGKLGGETDLLKNIFTTPQMYRYVRNGLDLFNPKGQMMGPFGRIFSQAAAFGQATQTILDYPAYFINTYGALQGMAANGLMFNPKAYQAAVDATKMMGQQSKTVRTGKLNIPFTEKGVQLGKPKLNKEAIALFERLKRAKVIDTDLSSEMIMNNINVYGKQINSNYGKVGKAYSKTMEKLSTAYGSPDTYAKLISFNAEKLSLQKMFPFKKNGTLPNGKVMNNKKDYNNFIFDEAAARTRDTMPSYAVASPLARSLSRTPIGTYALFPAEMVRTSKNIIKLALRDINQGRKTGNKMQMAHGLRRLSGLGVTAAGVDMAVNTNNEIMGVTSETNRGLSMLSPEWGKNSARFHIKGLEENKKGEIITRFVNSASVDAQDFLKVPARNITARVLANEDIPESEIDELGVSMYKSMLGPFTNPKFVVEALWNAVQEDKYNTSAGKGWLEDPENWIKLGKELGSSIEPGTIEALRKYYTAKKSEEDVVLPDGTILKGRGEGKGESRSGFPLSTKDLFMKLTTGVKPVTMNVSKAIGFNLSQDIKKIKGTRDSFINKIRGLDDQRFTPELQKELIDEYRYLQESKFKEMKKLAEKVNLFRRMSYEKRIGKDEFKTELFGLDKVLAASTNNFHYKIAEDLIYASTVANNLRDGGGIFMPDRILMDKRLRTQMENKGISYDFFDALAKVDAEFDGRSLVERKKGTEESNSGGGLPSWYTN